MPDAARLSSAVTFVRDLDRSVEFYTGVLPLAVADRSPTAALLVSSEGAQLVLRAIGAHAPHPLGSVGVQYLIWLAGQDDTARQTEQALRDRSALTGTRSSGDVTVVEGRDPDDIVVMIAHAGPGQLPLGLPPRIYGW